MIVAVYNGAKTLLECLDSVTRQSYPHIELIVIDGGSQDDTVAILQANDSTIDYWISEPDKGIYDAWNKATVRAKGDWICFLGADDYFWNEAVIEKMVAVMKQLPDRVRVVYGQVMLLDEGGALYRPIGRDWSIARRSFNSIMSIPHPGAMHRRDLFTEHGGFDPSFRIAGDYEFLLRALKTAEAAFIPGLITVGMRCGGVSSDPNNSILALREARRAQVKNGISRVGGAWIYALIKAYVKKALVVLLGEQAMAKLVSAARKLMGVGFSR